MARPTKLTDDLQLRILTALRIGSTHAQAALVAGVSESTFHRWMHDGEHAARGRFREFWEAVKRAEAEAAVRWLAIIDKSANEGAWQAAAWKLERRFPNEWGRRDRVQVEHSGEVMVRQVIEARTTVMQALAAFPTARLAVADALEALDAKQQSELEEGSGEHGNNGR
jgi:transposase